MYMYIVCVHVQYIYCVHARVERFARSRVGFWHAAILRVIPPVRVKSLGFACVYAKARSDGITRDLACI